MGLASPMMFPYRDYDLIPSMIATYLWVLHSILRVRRTPATNSFGFRVHQIKCLKCYAPDKNQTTHYHDIISLIYQTITETSTYRISFHIFW